MRLIRARQREGYSLDEFREVIRTMSREWLHDQEMQRYLRPETLFGPKFEGYLQRARLPSTTLSHKTAANAMAAQTVIDAIERGDL